MYVLSDDYFFGFRTLTADIDAGGGILDAYTLEVVVFDGFVGIEVDVFDCADFVKTYSEREDVDAVGRCLEFGFGDVTCGEPKSVFGVVEGCAVVSLEPTNDTYLRT